MRFSLFILLLLLAIPVKGITSHGVALLVVNRDYTDVPIEQAFPDVHALAQALVARGFVTTVMEDLSRDDQRFAIEQFVKTAPTNGVALIYFAGYLMPAKDDNKADVFLLPVDHNSGGSTDVVSRSMGIRAVLDHLKDESGASIAYVLLDNSVSNPRWSEQSIYDSLTSVELADNVLLGYAGDGFAGALAQLLAGKHMNLVAVIQAAVAEAGGRMNKPSTFMAPEVLFPTHSPGDLSEGSRAGEEWFNTLGMVFAWCPSRYQSSGKDYEPGFWLGKYELTKREFDLVTPKKPRGALASRPNHPRDAIRYNDILQFVEELNRRERFFNRLPVNWEYALPTDVEWEYASRSGSDTRFYFGSSPELLPAHANFADRSLLETGDEYFHYANENFDDGNALPATVGTYLPNAWGFHDLYGNLWEWTANNGELPVAKGCSWVSLPAYCDSSFTHRFARDTERNFIGFRLVLRKKQTQYEE